MKNDLVALVALAFDKRSWHGANLMSAIRGVRARRKCDSSNSFGCIVEQTRDNGSDDAVVADNIADEEAAGEEDSVVCG